MNKIIQVLKTKFTFSILNVLETVVILILIILLFRNCNKPDIESQANLPKIDTVKKHVDSKGVIHADITQHFFTESQVKQMTDSLRKVWNVKQISGITTTVTTIHDTIPVIMLIDTNKHTITALDSIKDIFISFEGNTVSNRGIFNFELTADTQTIAFVKMKRKLFQPQEYKASVTHTNSLFNTVAGSSFTTKEKTTLLTFGVGTGIAIGLNDKSIIVTKPAVFAGVMINLFSIKSR